MALDIRAIKERAAKARQVVHPKLDMPAADAAKTAAGALGWSFVMMRPTDLGMREVFAGGAAALSNQVKFQKEQVYAALTSWTGPKVRDIDPSAVGELADMPLPCERELFDELFGDRAELIDELGFAIMHAMLERRQEREGAEKNSPTSSAS